LNIGLDTIAFIDDSPFERAQVHNALPEVRVFNASECGSLLARPEFQVSSTGGSKRREVYQQNQLRTTTAKNFRNYVEFLHECNIRVFIKKLECQDLDRVRELSQRTNQMNFSEDRFTHQQLTSMLETEAMNAFVIDCQDKFGSYGTVGFIAVDQTANRMVSFMLSCRVQSKRIEHAILTHLLDKYSHADFRVNYQKTSSNAFSGKVFDDFMFEAEGLNTLVFRVGWEIPDDGIITVIEK
jgi:FkbH-like protein